MSRALPVTGLLVLGLAAWTRAPAQTTAEQVRRYLRLTQEATRFRDTLAAELKRGMFGGLAIDTIRVGSLTVITNHSRAPATRLAADSAWTILRRSFGEHANAVSATPVFVRYLEESQGDIAAQLINAYLIPISIHADPGEVAGVIAASLAPSVYRTGDELLRRWTGSQLLPAIRPTMLVTLYDELATAPWSTAQACFLGQLQACRAALGISGADPALDWFNAIDRRHYLRSHLGSSVAMRTRVEDCQGGEDAACVQLLRSFTADQFVPPFDVTARQLLLTIAVESGGPQAFDRLLSANQKPLDARLELAAGLPVDTLVARWRARILSAHPKTVAADMRSAWAAVVWGVAFTMAALRSTRWR